VNCSAAGLIALVLAAVAATVVAAVAALGGTVAPYPWDLGLLIGATALIAGVLFGLLPAIEGAFNDYQACRNRDGASSCSTRSISNLLTAIRVALGIALSTFGIAALKIVVPWIGKILAGQEIIVGVAACGVAVALLLALLAELQAYQNCRDAERRNPPTGAGGSGLTAQGPARITLSIDDSIVGSFDIGAGSTATIGISPPDGGPDDGFPEPTPEEVGETWEGEGIPPARDPRVTWYEGLTVAELWEQLSEEHNRKAALVTLKRPDLHRGYFSGVVLISESEVDEGRGRLLEIEGVRPYDGPDHEIALPIMADGRLYPAIAVEIEDERALAELVELSIVEAVEPLFVAQDGVGCSLPPYTPNPADGMRFANRVPWTYSHLSVTEAWDLYKVNNAIRDPGLPIRIGVVDTGVYQEEHQLTTVFHWSSQRAPAIHRSVVTQAWDDCGHGTRIAGLATAPLDTQNVYPKKIVGVAHGANLTTVKYNSGVVAFAGSRVALVNAIRDAIADGSRIVNLALGMPYWSSFVYDNIVDFYRTTETIFVCAAGTFVSSVVFPAAMSEVLAAAIVRSKDTANPAAGYERYGGLTPESAYGPEVDFCAISGAGDIPTIGGPGAEGGYQSLTTIGGSSSGTAHLSGILALAWGKNPSASRSLVVSRLRRAGSLKLISGEEDLTPGLSSYVGYGIPDAYLASGGSRRASISGPAAVLPGASYTLTATTDGWLPLHYEWNTGQRSRSATFVAGQSGTVSHSVTARNPLDGRSLTASHSVTIAKTHRRVLYSDPAIVRFPPYPFAGGVYDVKVNYGVTMPAGCAVLDCLGQKLDYVDGRYQNNGPPLRYLSLALIHGFTVSRPGGLNSGSLYADARVWHSGTNAIRMKIHYLISEPDGVDGDVPGATVHGWYPQ
jgi:hypothetical protein